MFFTSRKHLLCRTGYSKLTHQPYSDSEHTDHVHWRDASHLLSHTLTHQDFLSLMATVWDTQIPQSSIGFLPSAQHWGKEAPSALHACLKEAQRGCRDKTGNDSPESAYTSSCEAVPAQTQVTRAWLQAGAWLAPAQHLNPMRLGPGSQGADPRTWCPWYIKHHPLTIQFWSVSSLNLTDSQKISLCGKKSQLKTKQNKYQTHLLTH